MKRNRQFLAILSGIFLSTAALGQNGPVISEFMALNNSTIQDEDGDFPDWIEIYNSATDTVNLDGWFLTDDAGDYRKWAFPDMQMDPGEYLVVFASGKNRIQDESHLHTNFKLSSAGEFLALVKPEGTQYSTIFTPAYPAQVQDISYGMYQGLNIYFSVPTPGAENVSSTIIPPPGFSVGHGYHYASFDLHLSCEAVGANIYFTTDASTPNKTNGMLYTTPIPIGTTTIVRAVAIEDGVGSSTTITQSYIFPGDVIHQSEYQPGYPETSIDPKNEIEIPGNYGMKIIASRPDVNEMLIPSLESLPCISLVSDIDHLFSKSTDTDSGGIYV